MSEKICFCLAGWHFERAMLKLLAELPGADTYIVSHRPLEQVPSFVTGQLAHDRLLCFPNLGYDWGCYQQFINTNIWRQYDVIFFMHDDLLIQDLAFVGHALELLDGGFHVIGNGRNSSFYDWPHRQPYSYAHSHWIPPSLEFLHDTVRGSFLALPKDALARLGSFEVFWDPFHMSVGWGNRSLIASSGKMQFLFGEKTFAFLSDDYLVSDYIEEMERGGSAAPPAPVLWRYAQSKLVIPVYRWLGARLVKRRISRAGTGSAGRDLLTWLMSSIISAVSGVRSITGA